MTVEGASIDTRTLVAGQLFVPVVAERDGHDFIPAALAAGASAYLTTRQPAGGTAVVVADTSGALWSLGALARGRLGDRVVGITGSVGKTTVKDLVAGGLAARFTTHATHASFNNELGVPLTLLGAPDGVEAVVLELGARFPGDIARLRDLVQPAIGVITSIGTAHAEHMGGPEGVAREKGSLIEGLPAGGYAILNDVECGPDVRRRTEATVMTFGTATGDVRAHRRSAVTTSCARPCASTRPGGRPRRPCRCGATTRPPTPRRPWRPRCAPASISTLALAGVASTVGSAWRAEFWRTPSGLRILNDSYNANPASMAAALRNLALVDAPRRVAVLGEMAELGDGSAEAHRQMGDLAGSLGIEVVAVGGAPYGGTPAADIDEALELVEGLSSDCVVLIKASRSVGLDRLAASLRDGVAVR